jgi:hypothetical protein
LLGFNDHWLMLFGELPTPGLLNNMLFPISSAPARD